MSNEYVSKLRSRLCVYRYSSMYERNGRLHRDLFKAYGIRFIIRVSGEAGKRAVVPILLNIGSGIGLLAIVCLLLYIGPIVTLKLLIEAGCPVQPTFDTITN